MKLTLNKIKEYRPCKRGWEILLKSLNKTKADNTELDLMTVLKSNGIEDAIWCLRCFDYLDVCLFMADVTESVPPTYEANNRSKALRKAIQAIRDFKSGKITKDELNEFRSTWYATSSAAGYVAWSAAATAYDDAARRSKWEEIEVLFIKHFK